MTSTESQYMKVMEKRSAQRKTISLNAIMGYKNPALLRRLEEKEGMDKKQAQEVFEDMLRFLFLCGTNDLPLGPSEKIDTAWHHFILFTREYQKFCERYFGRFIHHSPAEVQKDFNGPEIARRTMKKAQEAFHTLSSNWSYANMNCVNCDTPSTNCQDPKCS